MAGVEADGPGIGAVHRTFSVLENLVGNPVSVEEPLKKGPRHCAQFSARTETTRARALARMTEVNFIVRGKAGIQKSNFSGKHNPAVREDLELIFGGCAGVDPLSPTRI